MNKYGYVSGMADEMALYIDYKVRSGFKEVSFIYRMRKFDSFCAARGITGISFTEDDSRAWGEKDTRRGRAMPLRQDQLREELYDLPQQERLLRICPEGHQIASFRVHTAHLYG